MNLLMVKRNLSLHIWQKSVVKNNIKFFWKTVIFVGVTKNWRIFWEIHSVIGITKPNANLSTITDSFNIKGENLMQKA